MKNSAASLQETFLKTLCNEKTSVAIYLISGIKLQGHISAFDQFSVLLEGQTSQVVYKHAISTIVPEHLVKAKHAE